MNISVKIVSWNLLAHKHTHHHKRIHKKFRKPEHTLSTDPDDETIEQKQYRHLKNREIISQLQPDILLCQEYSDGDYYNEDILSIVEPIDDSRKIKDCAIFYNRFKLELVNSEFVDLTSKKTAVIATFKAYCNNTLFTVCSFHFNGGDDSKKRLWQMYNLFYHLEKYSNNPIVLGGDANEKSIKLLNDYSNPTFEFIDEKYNSFLSRGLKFPIRIDYFAVNKRASFIHKKSYKENLNHPYTDKSPIGSDHFPIYGVLQL